MSQKVPSSNNRKHYYTGTLLANNLIISRAFIIAQGSQVLLVVFTVRDPSNKFNSALIPTSFKDFLTMPKTSYMYFSRYFGNSVANDDSDNKLPFISPGCISGIFHLSIVGSLSQGLSFLYFLWFFWASYSPDIFHELKLK